MHEHQTPEDSVAQEVLPGGGAWVMSEILTEWKNFCLPAYVAEEVANRFTFEIVSDLVNPIERALFDYIEAELSPTQRKRVAGYYHAISELEQGLRYHSVAVIAKVAAYLDPTQVGLNNMLQDALRRAGETPESMLAKMRSIAGHYREKYIQAVIPDFKADDLRFKGTEEQPK